ncbi:tryptophan synthase beta subunit-like PLP-dependent enzyme [Cladochytrium replicatum]|nr:tryptophan synthase beta subunit-like PLP-dependent enzyme [Cladochytrium replicatum]
MVSSTNRSRPQAQNNGNSALARPPTASGGTQTPPQFPSNQQQRRSMNSTAAQTNPNNPAVIATTQTNPSPALQVASAQTDRPSPTMTSSTQTFAAAVAARRDTYLRLILTARVYDVAVETPLSFAPGLSTRIGDGKHKLYLKREDLQPVFSFKIRGAYNRMASLSEEERARGVVACSAGNHAQGVAMSAKKLGIKATIVMPLATPSIKWANVKRLGAEVVLYGGDFDEAKSEAHRLAKEHGYTDIPPYDDPYVIAGQGTIGVELLRQHDGSKIDAVFVCIGGGGLAAGVAAYIKSLYTHIKVIGVETYDADAMTRSLERGERVGLNEVGLFADGAAVRNVGSETFRLCRDLLDGMVRVSTDEICAAIKDAFEETRGIVEPAGALGIAGMKKWVAEHGKEGGGTYVAVMSGANMNFDRLRFVADRAYLGENTEVLMTAIIPERPGSFMKLYEALHPRVVTEFSYRYGDADKAHIFLGFQVQSPLRRDEEVREILGKLEAGGMEGMDVSRNELAKTHGRYLVGGRSQVPYERVLRFTFPERSGALRHFLQEMTQGLEQFNVTLFQYRNYGGDVGRVLVGVQVDVEQEQRFTAVLQGIRYTYVDESANAMYRQFMRN